MNKPQYFDNLVFLFDPVVNQVIAVDKLKVARSFLQSCRSCYRHRQPQQPNSLRSMIATFIPASLKRPARGAPACPVPTMIASYAFDINRSFLMLLLRQFARFPQEFLRCPLDQSTNDNKIIETIGKRGAFLSRIESCWVGCIENTIEDEPDKAERLGFG